MSKIHRYYAVDMTATPPVAIEECIQVQAFGSRAARDAWVDESPGGEEGYQMAHGCWLRRGRQAVSAVHAERLMAAIMRGAVGGRQNGRAALAEVATMTEGR